MIYKIMPGNAWESARIAGEFAGAPVDLQDGYIHFSTAEQLAETAARHFSGMDDLVLIAVDPHRLGKALRWEPSRGGALFPHLYEKLHIGDVMWARPLQLGEDGAHVMPRDVQ